MSATRSHAADLAATEASVGAPRRKPRIAVPAAAAGIVLTAAFQALERRLVPWNYE